ncbi:MAG: Magnesium transporter MgtE [Calditrichaeota bacterium]|nr:Magnesium transporter MgtE [Calditrichota bacterium]
MEETPLKAPVPNIEDLRTVITDYLHEERFDQARTLLFTMHPAEIAALMTVLGSYERHLVFDMTPEEMQHGVLSELEEGDQERLLERLSDERILEILHKLESDDATDIIALLDETTRARILRAAEKEEREELEALLKYEEDTAGGLMAVELVTVFEHQTVGDAIERIRMARERGIESIHYVYVIDHGKVLKGRISLLDLMLAPRTQPVMELLDREMIVIERDTDQEEVAQIFQRYDLISAPVVDDQHCLIGRITVDDIVDVMHEEAEEDIGFIAGTGEEPVMERNLMRATRARLPWLVIAFIGELFGAVVVSRFEQSLATVLMIAFFIPVIIAVAGNVGIQSSTIVVRGLATGEIHTGRVFSRVGREVLVASMNGLILALILLVVVFFWKGVWLTGLAISLSLISVVIVSALVGSFTPFMLKRLDQDPALAAGPFITMTNDVVGLTLYLLITSAMLTG